MTRQMIPFRALICSALTLLLAACTSSDGGGPSGPQTPVASVEVTPSPASVPVAGTLQLAATLKDAAGAVLTGREITWSSSAVAIATVSQTGLVTGVAEGASVQIAATSEGISGTASVTVQVPVASVQVAPAAASVAVGGTVQLTTTLRDAGGNILVGRTVAWTSSDVALASVSPTGLVTGVAQGAATITATSEGKIATALITVVVTNFASLSAGRFHTCGVTTDGDAHCWGSAEDGQLGNGQTGIGVLFTQPVAVSGALTFDVISAGNAHTCGVVTTGSTLCWGLNADGQLGTGTGADAATPALVTGTFTFASVSVGSDHSCGLTTTGGAFCWGLNDFGQLGDGTTTTQLAPVAVGGAITFTSLSAGDDHACALDAAGGAYCWGRGDSGQLGDGTAADKTVPTAVFGTLTFTSLSAGGDHTCGLTSTGNAFCWGRGIEGQLGSGASTNSNLPVAAGALTFASLSAGGDHTCAVTSTGAAHCWGLNDFGQIGNGTSGIGQTLLTPTPVSGGLTFASLEAGDEHTCGVTGAGDAYCWGAGTFGRLGDGGFVAKNTPSKVVSPL